MNIAIVDDLPECKRLWSALGEPMSLFDLWDVRCAFHGSFARPPCFVVAEEHGRIVGLLPLCWIEEAGEYGFFPGETWSAKTWLEENRIVCRDDAVFCRMIEALDAPIRMRYMKNDSLPSKMVGVDEDEIGYLFFPPQFSYSFDEFRQIFPTKTLKRIMRDIHPLEERTATYSYDDPNDVAKMIDMNVEAFGEHSYFHDARFLAAFASMISWLQDQGMLSVTKVTIAGKTAAIDLGSVWNRHYKVLAGGVCRDFAGVAKLINFHHLQRACEQRFSSVDFLCGDFGWKERFRLSPRPLYKFVSPGPVNGVVNG